MSPLQLSVYWRLLLIFFFSPFLFFLDILTAAVAADSCHYDNDTEATSGSVNNQSESGELSERITDSTVIGGSQDVSLNAVY